MQSTVTDIPQQEFIMVEQVTEIWMRKEQMLLIYEATSLVELVILWMFRPAK